MFLFCTGAFNTKQILKCAFEINLNWMMYYSTWKGSDSLMLGSPWFELWLKSEYKIICQYFTYFSQKNRNVGRVPSKLRWAKGTNGPILTIHSWVIKQKEQCVLSLRRKKYFRNCKLVLNICDFSREVLLLVIVYFIAI